MVIVSLVVFSPNYGAGRSFLGLAVNCPKSCSVSVRDAQRPDGNFDKVLSWSPVQGAAGYQIWRCKGSNCNNWQWTASTSATTWTDKNGGKGFGNEAWTYKLSVKPISGCTNWPSCTFSQGDSQTRQQSGAGSAPASVNCPRACSVMVQDMIRTDGKYNKKVFWNAVEGADAYHLWRCEGSGCSDWQWVNSIYGSVYLDSNNGNGFGNEVLTYKLSVKPKPGCAIWPSCTSSSYEPCTSSCNVCDFDNNGRVTIGDCAKIWMSQIDANCDGQPGTIADVQWCTMCLGTGVPSCEVTCSKCDTDSNGVVAPTEIGLIIGMNLDTNCDGTTGEVADAMWCSANCACVDSDGANLKVRGNCTDSKGTYLDQCITADSVKENVCTLTGCTNALHTCDSFCYGGACLGFYCGKMFNLTLPPHYQTQKGDPNYDERADINKDGRIAGFDFSAVQSNLPNESWCQQRYEQSATILEAGPVVFGQLDLTQTTPNQVVGNRMFYGEGIVFDRSVSPNRAYIWDSGNSRVLAFASFGTCLGGSQVNQACINDLDCPGSSCKINPKKNADLIIGQPDAFHSACNGDNTRLMPASAATICSQPYPEVVTPAESADGLSMAVDADHNLYVLDKWNYRVLKYLDPLNPSKLDGKGDAIADFVWGQKNFEGRDCNQGKGSFFVTAETICPACYERRPQTGDWYSGGVDVDPLGNVWLTDINNHRVLRFPANSKTADLVIGQPDFTSRYDQKSCYGGTVAAAGIHPFNYQPDPAYLCLPKAVRYDAHTDRLFVLDYPSATGRFRISIYNAPFENGMAADEVVLSSRNESSATGTDEYNLYRPTAIEVDPFNEDAIWVHDSGRALYLQKIDGIWKPTKVLQQPNIGIYIPSQNKPENDKIKCNTTVKAPPWMCNIGWTAGGIGIDSEENVYITSGYQGGIFRFKSPIPNATADTRVAYAADTFILQPEPNEWGWEPLDNQLSEYGFAYPNSVGLVNYANGVSQMFVADRNRVLFWNNYHLKGNGAAASGALFQQDTKSMINDGMDLTNAIQSDSQGRVWVGREKAVFVFNGPITQGEAPFIIIPQQLPLRFGGVLTVNSISGMAYDERNDALWLSDTDSHRVVRVARPLDTSREVDMVLGQPNLAAKHANRDVDDVSQYPQNGWLKAQECPNMVADGFANLGALKLDNYGNLYIVDTVYEGWRCSNNRILEYDSADLLPDPTKNFFEHGERMPMRVYGSRGFTDKRSEQHYDTPIPGHPISLAFDNQNRMYVLADGWSNAYMERVFMYENPLPDCTSPCKVEPTALLPIPGSQLIGLSVDPWNNLAVLDHTTHRVLLYKGGFQI
ncbi:MAG: hypothetical protein ABIG95_01060 [Candidatus Woesearchaeota archaeon]